MIKIFRYKRDTTTFYIYPDGLNDDKYSICDMEGRGYVCEWQELSNSEELI